MLELTDKAAISLAFDYYIGLGFSITDSYTLIDILLKARVGGLIIYAYQQRIRDSSTPLTTSSTDVDLIRDTFNDGYENGYEKGYAKGKADEMQVVRQAQSDRDLYDWKREILK